MTQEKTPWFPKTKRPQLNGVYEVLEEDDDEEGWFAWWDGRGFGFRSRRPEVAAASHHEYTCLPRRTRWRGLAQKPEGGAR